MPRTDLTAASSSSSVSGGRSRIQRRESFMSLPCQTTGPVSGVRFVMAGILGAGRRSAQGLAHVDRGRIVEAGMGLARDLAVAERGEKLLIVGQGNADTQANAGQAAGAGVVLDGGNQSLGETQPARGRQHGEAAKIEIAFQQL